MIPAGIAAYTAEVLTYHVLLDALKTIRRRAIVLF